MVEIQIYENVSSWVTEVDKDCLDAFVMWSNLCP